jgi:nucleotide-binding universal stress UspA family protein
LERIVIRYRHVLVPTDFSATADVAWRHALALARPLGARLHLLHVVSAPVPLDAWGQEPSLARRETVVHQAVETARQRLLNLQRALPAADQKGGRMTVAVASGSPVDQVLKYIDEEAIDLVVVGADGEGKAGPTLLGSVADRLIRRSPVPVLAVHDPARALTSRAARSRRAGPTPAPLPRRTTARAR